MRKFISLLAAVAVMMTMVVSFATVASATAAAPTVRLVVTQAATSGDVLPGASVWNWGHASGRNYDVYNVSVVYSGLALSATYDEELDDWAGGYKGQSITSASAVVGITSTGTSGTDYRWAWATSSIHPAPTKSVNNSASPAYSFASATAVYPGSGADAVVSSTDDIVLCSFAIAVNPEKPVTLSLTSATIAVGNFDGSTDATACYHFDSKPASSVEYNSAASTLDVGVAVTKPDAPIDVLATSMKTFTPATLNLTVGGSTGTITAALDDAATDKTIDWSTSDPSVATVAGGVVTPVGAGTATITATAHDGSGVNATCAVTVAPALPAPIPSTGFKKIDKYDTIKNLLKDETIDADANYGVGRIDTTVDTANYSYKVVAQDAESGETKEWDAPISGAELTGTINFIAIVKSATHKIGSIWLQAYNK